MSETRRFVIEVTRSSWVGDYGSLFERDLVEALRRHYTKQWQDGYIKTIEVMRAVDTDE